MIIEKNNCRARRSLLREPGGKFRCAKDHLRGNVVEDEFHTFGGCIQVEGAECTPSLEDGKKGDIEVDALRG